jgi:hypothetical protein
MCGIGCLLVDGHSKNGNVVAGVTRSSIEGAIKRRGPNSTQSTTTADYDDWFIGSVLHIQGSDMITQPFIDESCNIVAWNGEVFSGITNFISGISDTTQISALFDESIRNALCQFDLKHFDDLKQRELMSLSALQAVTQSISDVNGPYAFIYYHKLLQLLIYGRDPLGRRSLLQYNCIGFPIALSSVWPSDANDQSESSLCGDVSSDGSSSDSIVTDCSPTTHDQNDIDEAELDKTDSTAAWVELPITGLFGSMMCTERIDSEAGLTALNGLQPHITCRRSKGIFSPWGPSRIKLSRICSSVSGERFYRSEIEEGRSSDEIFASSSALLLAALLASVRCRVASVGFTHSAVLESTGEAAAYSRKCRVGVLFSGGIDSVVLAALLHLCMDDAEEPIDLLNVAFTGAGDADGDDHNSDVHARTADSKSKVETPAPDRLAAISALQELKTLYPTRDWRLVHIDVTSDERNQHEGRVKSLIQPRNTHMDLNIGTALWFASRGKGYLKEYSAEDMDKASGVKDQMGRPLVRAGGLGHAQSVGLPSWNARTKVQGSEGVGNEVQGPPLGLQCSNAECRRVGKRGCPRALCKRCCNKVDKDSSISSSSSSSSSGNSSSSGSSCNSNSSSNSVNTAPSSEHSNLSNMQCRVHKSSAKELEKMEKKLKERKGQFQDNTADNFFSHHTIEEEVSFSGVELEVAEEVVEEIEAVEVVEPITSSRLPPSSSSPAIESSKEIPYSTSCRALLIGIGADEQMVSL